LDTLFDGIASIFSSPAYKDTFHGRQFEMTLTLVDDKQQVKCNVSSNYVDFWEGTEDTVGYNVDVGIFFP
jgi:long-subunit fatty acid transport protein